MLTYDEFKSSCISFGIKFSEKRDNEGRSIAFPGAQTKDHRIIIMSFYFHKSGAVYIGSNVILKRIPRDMDGLLSHMNNIKGSTYVYKLNGYSLSAVQPFKLEEWMEAPDLAAVGATMSENMSSIVEAIENRA